MNIGIDIDGVINNLDEYHIVEGTKFCYENMLPFNFHINEYKLRNKFNWDRKMEQQFYLQNYMFFLTTSQYLRPGAKDVIQKLYKNHNIFIITSRQNKDIPEHIETSISDITTQWLHNNCLPYNQLIFTTSDKSETLIKEEITLMIEDNPEYLKQVSDIPINFLCFNTNYNLNKFPANVSRIYSWYEILIYIENINQRKE